MTNSLLSQVVKGKIKKPHLILIYGPDKVGKSTFASEAPNPIFLGTEKGTSNLDVARLPAPGTYEQVLQSVQELTDLDHPYKTLVIDSLDWLEPLVFEKVCRDGKKEKIEDFGYGAGYKNSIPEWRKLIAALERLQEKKQMSVLLIAHSEVKTFNDPQENAAYDRYQLKLYDRASAIFREFVDSIFFANFEVHTTKKEGERKSKAFGDDKRFIYTERRPAFDAGSRFDLPYQIELSWNEYVKGLDLDTAENPEVLKTSITGLLQNVKDKELFEKVSASVEKAGNNPDQLRKIKKRLNELLAA